MKGGHATVGVGAANGCVTFGFPEFRTEHFRFQTVASEKLQGVQSLQNMVPELLGSGVLALDHSNPSTVHQPPTPE